MVFQSSRREKWVAPTCGLCDTYLAQWRMRRMASILVSGKAVLHTNSARHLTTSWKESIAEAKCSLKVFTEFEQWRRKGTNQSWIRITSCIPGGQLSSCLASWQLIETQQTDVEKSKDRLILTDDMASGLEGQLDDGLIVIRCCVMKNWKDVLPTWADVGSLGVHHLSHTSDHHISYSGRPMWHDDTYTWCYQVFHGNAGKHNGNQQRATRVKGNRSLGHCI